MVWRSINRSEMHAPEFINDKQLKVTLKLCSRARAVTFVVTHSPVPIGKPENPENTLCCSRCYA